MSSPEPILFCWSGGKDSAMALHTLLQQPQFRVTALLTTVTEGYDRISIHGVRRALLLQQAESIGLPLHEVRIPSQCVNPVYEARMEHALRILYDQGVRKVAFGDIFLEDLRAWRENNLARMGMTALFPIWKRDTHELIRFFHIHRFRAIAACIDPKILVPSFAGRELDDSFFRDLPPNADPCGENGEFHTFVFDGPLFRWPIPVRTGEIVHRGGFVFCDLLPTERSRKMNAGISQKENVLYRLLLAVAIIVIAAALRIAPHPWNFTPVGAIALFSGAILKDRRLAFAFPLLVLFAGDLFVGLYKPGLMLLVYASFSVSVLIGRFFQGHRTVLRIGAGTLLGSTQFFLVSNFAAWWLLNSYPKTGAGLATCYFAGLPFFGNTLAGDFLYAAVFFGAFALAERLFPALRQPVLEKS